MCVGGGVGMPRAPPKPLQRPWGTPGHCPRLPSSPSAYGGSLAPPRGREPFQLAFFPQHPEIRVAPRSSCIPTARDFPSRRLDFQTALFLLQDQSPHSLPPSPSSGFLSPVCSLWIEGLKAEIPEREAFLPSLRCPHFLQPQCCLNWGHSSDLFYP